MLEEPCTRCEWLRARQHAALHLALKARDDIGEALGLVLEVLERSLALLHHALQLVVEFILHLVLTRCCRFLERFKLFHSSILLSLVLRAVPALQ
jgi:hypothetical protein